VKKENIGSDFTCLLARGQEVNHLLHRSRPVHVQRDGYQVLRDRFTDDVALFVRRELKELLAKVIPKRI
jgi:hypothetical protein